MENCGKLQKIAFFGSKFESLFFLLSKHTVEYSKELQKAVHQELTTICTVNKKIQSQVKNLTFKPTIKAKVRFHET